MQAIAVLANEVFEKAPVLQLHQGHVRRRWNGLQRGVGFEIEFSPLCPQRPGAFWAAEIGNARGRGDPSTGEGDEMLAVLDLIGQIPRDAVDNIGRIEVLSLGDLGGRQSHGISKGR